ncbi:MAG: RNA 2',3'-cyclic phosphodiesterase [Planctomycetes bacterium]|nr:RNA 2',3'-cyclic phosphodiesterase [Planctomycetota bacterium]
MDERIRCFVALEVDREVAGALGAAAVELRQAGADVKWTDLAHSHLTLKFLGELPEALVAQVRDVVESVARGYAPVRLLYRRVGCFPPSGPPRVLWAGCEDREGRLSLLVRDLETRLALLGIPKESRGFQAHVTLGRVRSPRRSERLRPLLASLADAEFGSQTVAEVVLFRSELRPQGPTYTALARCPLAAGGAA